MKPAKPKYKPHFVRRFGAWSVYRNQEDSKRWPFPIATNTDIRALQTLIRKVGPQ